MQGTVLFFFFFFLIMQGSVLDESETRSNILKKSQKKEVKKNLSIHSIWFH
jgi:hypothetical protein